MDWTGLLTYFLHIDKAIGDFIILYGNWIYLILFAVIFIETGVVFFPFLPGDSLIFVTGVFAASNLIDVFLLFIVLTGAAILGDTLNYWIGKYFGREVARRGWISWEKIEKTEQFYEKHGGKTIILARFIPIVRTIAPFIAGIGRMEYYKFLFYNVIGAISWVVIFLTAGYYFGTIDFVQQNLTFATLIVIIISLIPVVIEFIKTNIAHKKETENKSINIEKIRKEIK